MKNIFISFLIGCVLSGIIVTTLHLATATPALPLVSPVATSSASFSVRTPPRSSLRGAITTLSGDIYWESREATTPARITQPQQLLQGETLIASQAAEATFSFDQHINATLLSNTSVSIIQTLPDDMVFEQTRGHGMYALSSETPISLRVSTLLMSGKHARIAVIMDEKTQTILTSLTEGELTLAYNSASFDTRVVHLMSGDQFFFNEETRTGRIR